MLPLQQQFSCIPQLFTSACMDLNGFALQDTDKGTPLKVLSVKKCKWSKFADVSILNSVIITVHENGICKHCLLLCYGQRSRIKQDILSHYRTRMPLSYINPTKNRVNFSTYCIGALEGPATNIT